MARRRRSLLLPAFLLFLAALLFLLWTGMYAGLDLIRIRNIFAPVRTSVSWSILEEIREMEELETAAYDMQVVFPFDFTGDDDVDWTALKLQYDRAPSQFMSKADPAWYRSGVLPDEWKHAGLYAMCREAGIDPGRPDHRFIVLSVGVSAGIDLAAWLEKFDTGEPGGEVGGIEISENEDGTRTLVLPAPPIAVTTFSVEDRDITAEGFPDVDLSPGEWGKLVSRLEPMLREMALVGGLPGRAASRGKVFLTEIFTAAGYDDVRFTEG